MNGSPILPAGDLKHILAHTCDIWREIRGTRLFITGATGFFGKWLLESIVAANDALGVKVAATLLSRDPTRFARELPRLALRPEFDWLAGEIDSFSYPTGQFDFVVHLATPSAAEVGAGGTTLLTSALLGMHRLFQFTRQSRAKRLLFASSGAVYGHQPVDLSHISEDYIGAPDTSQPMSAYGELKRVSELMCALTPDVECVIARGFAFVGPYLPLTDKFAIGSFMRDALAGGPIRILGDGTPLRSYLYAADLAVWLLTLLVKGTPSEAYNVGSDESIDLTSLAGAIATAGDVPMEIAQPRSSGPPQRYIPAIDKARKELELEVRIPLTTALRRTMDWSCRPPKRASYGRINVT
ncbi:NAD(P)-dependent oxidoreductase [Candidatus Accumulibacter sp. ACC003]|uniref:NAD-dependent epimerase/dehydratase family protein n=1 Tax=Candidatus Accumulibacter sp. ACC003 TaxID=2823334 RepID=UPI0025C67AA0|nr:NAD(P)-dependent oxidoreductase [Candidatus Accumulibacter sp. ACC003]